MTFVECNEAFETWLASQCDIVSEGLKVKHKKMAKNPFNFLRATFFRWAQTISGKVDATAGRLLGQGACQVLGRSRGLSKAEVGPNYRGLFGASRNAAHVTADFNEWRLYLDNARA